VAATEQRDEPATVRQPHLIGVSTELKALSISTYSKISDAFIICIASYHGHSFLQNSTCWIGH